MTPAIHAKFLKKGAKNATSVRFAYPTSKTCIVPKYSSQFFEDRRQLHAHFLHIRNDFDFTHKVFSHFRILHIRFIRMRRKKNRFKFYFPFLFRAEGIAEDAMKKKTAISTIYGPSCLRRGRLRDRLILLIAKQLKIPRSPRASLGRPAYFNPINCVRI